MPTRWPPASITGSRLTCRWYISRAACSTVSSGLTVTTLLVMKSPAVTPSAFFSSWWCTMAVIAPPLSAFRASFASRSASETMPITFWSSSRTGKALTRYLRSSAAISLNDAPCLTATTGVVMTSLTFAFIVLSFSRRGPGVSRWESGQDVEVAAGTVGRRVAEAVADGYHARDVPVEDGQHVGPAHDADQVVVRVDHGQPLDLAGIHQPGGPLDRVVRGDDDRRAGHHAARRYPAGLLVFLLTQQAGDHARHPLRLAAQGFLGQHVGLRHDADYPAAVVQDRERADPVLMPGHGHIPERRVLLHPDDLGGHDVLDGGLHRRHLFSTCLGLSG